MEQPADQQTDQEQQQPMAMDDPQQADAGAAVDPATVAATGADTTEGAAAGSEAAAGEGGATDPAAAASQAPKIVSQATPTKGRRGSGGARGRGRGRKGRGGSKTPGDKSKTPAGGSKAPTGGSRTPGVARGGVGGKKKRRGGPRAGPALGAKQAQQQPQQQVVGGKGGRPAGALTVDEIVKDRLTRLAEENWSPAVRQLGKPPPFKPELVEEIYNTELGGAQDKPPSARRVQLLEISQYLENYLWPHFDAAAASPAHVMSILLMLNEKFKEQVSAWACFQERKDDFPAFLHRVLTLKADHPGMRMHERVAYLVFVINAFQSLEEELVRGQVLRLVSLPLWHSLSRGRLQLELHDQPQLARHWKHLAKKEAKAAREDGYVPIQQRPEATFIPSLIQELLDALVAVTQPPAQQAQQGAANGTAAGHAQQGGGRLDRQLLLYCERSVEFFTDMLSQLPTRRFLHAVLEDQAVLVKCYMSPLYKHPQGRLFVQLVDLLRFYMSFPIHDHTGDPLGEEEVNQTHYDRVQQLQRLFFKHVPKLRELALANCGTLEKREVLRRELAQLGPLELRALVTRQLRLVSEEDPWADDAAFLAEVMVSTYERRRPQAELVNEMPLYPTEALLFDENQVPSVHYTGEGVLALPKLNLQFLTFHDYLLRNFNLFRLEATYEIREDVVDVLKRMGAYLGENDVVGFSGWARMAQPLDKFGITEVRKPRVGENKPAAVTAEVTINTAGMRSDIRKEWDDVKQHDVLFLLSISPPDAPTAFAHQQQQQHRQGGEEVDVMGRYGLRYVRGAEVIEVRDEDGKLMNDFTGRVRPDEWSPPVGTIRTITVALDTAQYQLDLNYLAKHTGSEDVYASFNLLMRRKPKENNFKAVLESIRDLMNEDMVVPPWLHDILLGYGDPGAAQYTNMPGTLRTVDFKDTFLDADHVREAFPEHEVEFVNKSKGEELQRPFRITFPPFKEQEEQQPAKAKRKAGAAAEGDAAAAQQGTAAAAAASPKKKLLVESYTPPDPGPYPQDVPPQNTVRFTPVQTGAILSGVQPGLTMVVGPPGTGKTDTAVQIMHILYHNCPNQRTLLVTHSNQALNDLFTKIVERDVPARYLLRLGMGEQELDTELDFSRVGRVNAMLARRLELLAEVERLAKLLGVAEEVAYTCETAAYFWLLHVLSRWEKFLAQCAARGRSEESVAELFPFKGYFADAPQPLFKGRSYEEDMEKAKGCFRHLKTMFQELEEIRPFELLKTQADRVNYLSTKQAKIVAMTCTHAALKRREFLELGFKYDNLLMEEAGQILEIETFIPMLLQRPDHGVNRLKRVILIGDHHQLPPVVKNMAIQKYSRLDQSLFTRFIRLGTPYIELNAQGRARPSLAKLYNWRYRQLGDLPAVAALPAFQLANPGLALDFQFVDVQDFNGRGESEPVAYFYQNLGEAEYVVSLYQYMRLLGYPASKISILTTYNGQKALLRDVIERRCANHPAFGRPAKVTTVDKYQGQQNDYVLLSLVRTRAFGHLRDVRRLVVAMSRARLGLYVFGRAHLFGNCYELQPTFSQLLARPMQLCLVPQERYDSMTRLITQLPPPALIVHGPQHMAQIVAQIAAGWEVEQLMQQQREMEEQMQAQAQAETQLGGEAGARDAQQEGSVDEGGGGGEEDGAEGSEGEEESEEGEEESEGDEADGGGGGELGQR